VTLTPDVRDIVARSGSVRSVVAIMGASPRDLPTSVWGCGVLADFAFSGPLRPRVGSEGGIAAVVLRMLAFPDCEELQASGVAVLWLAAFHRECFCFGLYACLCR
jgi:hypothetical protein